MKNLLFVRQLFLLVCVLGILPVAAQQLAFPGAEGFGRFTTGGRGGAVIEVTNLNDSGPGSFRAAVTASGPRTVVFRVSGIIRLQSVVRIRTNDLTIAGQTAPGDGICIADNTVQLDANNIIVRHMRFRMGDLTQTENDSMWGRYMHNIIIDHCSLSWSTDETGSFYDNTNFTMQWCILSESLFRSVHDKGDHGYGGIWGGAGATFHHNLLAHHSSRNPRFNGARYTTTGETELVDFRNNVVYNWAGNSSYGGENGNHNMINNYYKYGPGTGSGVRNRIVDAAQATGYAVGRWYVDGNYVWGYPAITADNWAGGVQRLNSTNMAAARRYEPFAVAPVRTQTAEEAFLSVLDSAGAILPKRDPVDARIVQETRTGTATYGGARGAGTGIIDTQETVGGWPVYNTVPAPLDTDRDGMPDAWETENGLNPNDAADRNLFHASGYTNLEVYLNSLTLPNVTSLPQENQLMATVIYPNPFTAAATIAFELKQQGQVTVQVTDLTGKLINTLLDTRLTPGAHSLQWNGTDAKENSLPGGLYFVSIQMGNDRVVKRVALIRE